MINREINEKVEKIYSKLGIVELFAFLRVYKIKHNGHKVNDVLNVSLKMANKLREFFNIPQELISTTIGKDLWDKCYIIPFNKSNDEIRLEYKQAILYCILKKPLLYTSQNKPLNVNIELEQYNLFNYKEAI